MVKMKNVSFILQKKKTPYGLFGQPNNLQDPVQNENVDPLVQKLLISRQQ